MEVSRKFHTKLSFLPVKKKLSKTGVKRKNNIIDAGYGTKKVGNIKTEVIGKIDRNGTVEHAQLLL